MLALNNQPALTMSLVTKVFPTMIPPLLSLKQQLAIEAIPARKMELRKRLAKVKEEAFRLYMKDRPSGDEYYFHAARCFFNSEIGKVDELAGVPGLWVWVSREGKDITEFQPL